METCKIEGCGRPIHVKSAALCSRHYNRLRTTGTTADGPRARRSFEDRFWSYVHVVGDDECWHWTGQAKNSGYGYIGRGGRKGGKILSHRAAWMLTNGEIPSGYVVRHICHNRSCCNPAHLMIGTQGENVQDMWERPSGFPKGNTKLTDNDVLAIRRSSKSNAELARSYGVLPSHIWGVRNGRCWPAPQSKED